MENNEFRVNNRYRFSSRLKGEVELTIFNDYFLQARTRQLKRSSDFKMELATLDPTAEHVVNRAIHWLAASLLSLLAAAAMVDLLVTGGFANGNIQTPLIGLLLSIMLGAAFATLAIATTQKKWVFKTRAARYPLVEIPYNKQGLEAAKVFQSQLQHAIESNVTKRGYTNDDLFAGEMRMLRRLVKKSVISQSVYDRAKEHMLKSHQQATV